MAQITNLALYDEIFPYVRLLILVLVLLPVLYKILRIGSRPRDLPPGPPTIPILGNIHQLPSKDIHKQFLKWAQEYGPVYSLMLGTTTTIVLSSGQAVKDLLDQRGDVYSSRPDAYIGGTLCSGGYRILFMKYGERWRAIRRLVHALLNIKAAKTFEPYQLLEKKQLLAELVEKPDEFWVHLRRYSNSLTTAMIFGWRGPTLHNERSERFWKSMEDFFLLGVTGTAALIEYFPFLRKLPDFMLPVQAGAKAHHQREKTLYGSYFLEAKHAIQDGQSRPSFCVSLVREQEKQELSDDQCCYITGALLEAGSDTTAGTLYGFVQAMSLFPEAQKNAQEEIDRIVGDGRLPDMQDWDSLHYARGCVKESLRWMPTTILGAVPHATTREDFYNGYRIPEGAAIVNNVYGIHNDPTRYPNPRKFDPERYLGDMQTSFESANNPDSSKRDNYTFGAGRRFCPGTHIADRSLFLAIAGILWAFEIVPKIDQDGKPILPDAEALTQGFSCHPVPYEVDIKPRSQKRAEMVLAEWKTAERDWIDPDTKQWKEMPEGVALPRI